MGKRPIIETSQAAFRSLQPEQLRQTYKDILFALSQLGEATTEEVAQSLRVPHAKIWKRHSEMEKMGLIYRPGNKRLLSSGRNGFTWKRVESGQPVEKVTEKAMSGTTVSDFSKNIQKIQQTLF